MSASIQQIQAWLGSLKRTDDFLHVSPIRPYAHAEELYDAQYGVVEEHPEEGLGLCALLLREGLDTTGPALEIGCGTGQLTTGIARGYPGACFLVTDASPSFLKITRQRLASLPIGSTTLHYVIFNGDDLDLLPQDAFSLIAMRSTLHHILNVRQFITSCATRLRPGGTLAMSAEPCESGYVLMGAITKCILPAFAAAGVEIQAGWREKIDLMAETMKFYCRRDVEKSAAEDKHLFRVHELADLASSCGLRLRYFPNAAYPDFCDPGVPPGSNVRFSVFFPNYLRYCMGFPLPLVDLVTEHLQPQIEYVDACYPSHPGPLFTGVFLFVKEPSDL
ncbi:MAG: class I SAM-dependent methyltransferase [Opitutus sp.]